MILTAETTPQRRRRQAGMALLLMLVSVMVLTPARAAATADYRAHPAAQAWLAMMVTEHGFERAQLEALLAQARRQQSILDAIARPAEKTKSWAEYRAIFLTPTRIDAGVRFWEAHRDTLAAVERRYGVPAEMVVAIAGVETLYGRITGRHRVLDALATLAFDYPPRSEFFTRELTHYLLLTRAQQRDPGSLNGSYAGAMGLGQFMPSSYRSYAVDFDADGRVDIWDNPADALASIANYFARHGWRPGEAVATRAQVQADVDVSVLQAALKPRHTIAELRRAGYRSQLSLPDTAAARAMRLQGDDGEEFWLGLHNFYVITRYNHSQLYALAVYQLSQAIRQQRQLQAQASLP